MAELPTFVNLRVWKMKKVAGGVSLNGTLNQAEFERLQDSEPFTVGQNIPILVTYAKERQRLLHPTQ